MPIISNRANAILPNFNPTVETLTGTATVSSWNSLVELNITANTIITLPAIGASDLGKAIEFKRLDNTAFTVSIIPSGIQTTEITTISDLNVQYGALTVRVDSSSSSEQVNNLSLGAAITTTPLTYGRVLALLDLASTSHINTDPGTKIPFTGTVYASGMTVNAGSLTPSISGRYRADWLCMATSTDFLADGIFFVVQNGVSVGQVSYNMNEASAVNQSTGFIDVDLVAGQEVALHYRTRHTASDGISWDRGSYFQLTQLQM